MIIENPDLFKSWLTSILEPLCDADPAALAKYVYALVKKEKPLDELRDGMIDQLDVFLQHETKPFVDMLFKALDTQDYLSSQPAEEKVKQPTPPPELRVEPEAEENTVPTANGIEERPRIKSPVTHRVVVNRISKPNHEHTLVKVLPLNELLEESLEQPPRRRDRRGDMLRDKDDRRRRRSRSWERRARPRRPTDIDHERRSKRKPISRSPSPRRYRNRSPPALDRINSRSRSRSPVPRDSERERDRLRLPRELERDRMSRDRMSRDRDHRERMSLSRDRDRSRDRSISPHIGSRLEANDAYKRRCRDFDEKGYCMQGDLCQWDHGADPVVLEDSALTALAMPPPVPEYNPLAPDIWMSGAAFPPYHPHPHPPRELIPIPRVRHELPPPPAARPLAPLQRPPHHTNHNFDYNRLGANRPPLSGHASNCSLEVKKVPRGLNDITHLNNHFAKFGKIVNIQVCFEGDQEGALITFSNPTEANVAYKSTEAVLNNRFIKVFWHNPENKQENVAPHQANKQTPRQQQQHPMSQNKVLINKDNMKATQDIKTDKLQAAQIKETANGQEPKKEAPKPVEKSKLVMEQYKRAQALLDTQLQQQLLMIERLESGNVTGPQKEALMEAINSAQEGIEKLRKELVAYNKSLRQMQDETVARSLSRLQLSQVQHMNAKKPKTREEAQKEILDAELDMFTKQQEAQDVTDLMKKVAELRRQMTIQFPTHVIMRRPHPRGGSRTLTNHRFTASKVFTNQSVDHRPRAILVSGFEADDLEPLVKHFTQFGEITGKEVNLAVPELVLQFKARAVAELAAVRGRHYNDRTLKITWVTSNKPIPSVASISPNNNGTANGETTQDENKQTETTMDMHEDPLLRFDEEDDEDSEDRSWRR